MATLLRQPRRCDACQQRRHCSVYQLLQPRLHDKLPFYEWHACWLCWPCAQPVLDLFSRADDQVVRISPGPREELLK